jgi:hypothetical protein
MAANQSVLVDAATGRNRANGGRFARNPSSRQVKLTVATRQQTPEEARRYTAAYQLLVGEIVRRESSRVRGTT